MKPAPFRMYAPHTVAQAVATLAALEAEGQHAKVLAGGQSLVPVLAMRLAEPGHLVDINGVAGLDAIDVSSAGVRVGALVRHAELLRHAEANRVQPLLSQALNLVAHATIRNRGTTVGSLAHADPSGEMTAVSVRGEREIPAAEFFVGPLESSLAADELALSAFFPAAPAGAGTAFVEMARRHGDYALSGVGAVVIPGPSRDEGAPTISVSCGFLSVSETPLVLDLSDAWAAGEDSVMAVVRAAIDPQDDIHASADYRRHITGILAVRAIREALARVREEQAA